MDKKGMERNTLISMILIIFVAGIILFWTTNLYADTIRKSTDPQVCRLAVELAAAPKKTGVLGPLDVQCGVRNVVENVEGNKEKQKEILANEMYKCWYQYGEGNVDFMSNFQGAGFSSYPSCYICSIITNVKGVDLQYKDAYDALNTKKNKDGKTYLELLNKNLLLKQDDTGSLSKGEEPIYIFYYAYKFNKPWSELAKDSLLQRIPAVFSKIGVPFVYQTGFGAYVIITNKIEVKKWCGNYIYPEKSRDEFKSVVV